MDRIGCCSLLGSGMFRLEGGSTFFVELREGGLPMVEGGGGRSCRVVNGANGFPSID